MTPAPLTLRARIFDATGAHWPYWVLLAVVLALIGAPLLSGGVALAVLAMATTA